MESNANANASGSIYVVIADAATGLPVNNASVQMLGRDNRPKSAGTKNGVIYDGLPIGNGYTFRIEALGYASMI